MKREKWWTNTFYNDLLPTSPGDFLSSSSTSARSSHLQSSSSPKGVASLNDPVPSQFGGSSGGGESLSSLSSNTASHGRSAGPATTVHAGTHGGTDETKMEIKSDDDSGDDDRKPASRSGPAVDASLSLAGENDGGGDRIISTDLVQTMSSDVDNGIGDGNANEGGNATETQG